MLVMDRATGALHDDLFASLASHLRPGDLLVLNDSRVIPARLYAHRTLVRDREEPTGRIEVMLTEPAGDNRWRALVRPGRKVAIGERLVFPAPYWRHRARSRSPRARPVRRAPARVRSVQFDGLLRGARPHRPRAAAALHPSRRRRLPIATATRPFSPASAVPSPRPPPACTSRRDVLAQLSSKGIEIARITLHVGLGTFAPLRVERVERSPSAPRALYHHFPGRRSPSIAPPQSSPAASSPSAPPSSAPSKPPHSPPETAQSSPTPAQPISSSRPASTSASSARCSPTSICPSPACSCWSAPSPAPSDRSRPHPRRLPARRPTTLPLLQLRRLHVHRRLKSHESRSVTYSLFHLLHCPLLFSLP